MAPGEDERGTIGIGGAQVPFGPDLLFGATDVPGFVLHGEICEDMFVPIPPSAEAALAGATVLANLSGVPSPSVAPRIAASLPARLPRARRRDGAVTSRAKRPSPIQLPACPQLSWSTDGP